MTAEERAAFDELSARASYMEELLEGWLDIDPTKQEHFYKMTELIQHTKAVLAYEAPGTGKTP